MNYAKQVAEMLGVEIGEKFRIKGHPDMGTFWFVDDNSMGLRDIWQYDAGSEMYESGFEPKDLLEQILAGFYKVEKLLWKPKQGDEYWHSTFLLDDLLVTSDFWNDSTIDLERWKAGNYFRTREEAKTKGKELMERIKKEYEEA